VRGIAIAQVPEEWDVQIEESRSQTTDVRVEEGFRYAIRVIIIMIDMLMMTPMFARPQQR
jgi:hypothetical protein